MRQRFETRKYHLQESVALLSSGVAFGALNVAQMVLTLEVSVTLTAQTSTGLSLVDVFILKDDAMPQFTGLPTDHRTGKIAALKSTQSSHYPNLRPGTPYKVLRFGELTPGMHIEVSPGQEQLVMRSDFDISDLSG